MEIISFYLWQIVPKGMHENLVPKGMHENRTKGVENKVDDTLKLVVFLDCAHCYERFLKSKR